MSDFLKLLYRPEDVIENNISKKNKNIIVIIIMVVATVFLIKDMTTAKSNFDLILSNGVGYVILFFIWVWYNILTFSYVALFSVTTMLIGVMVDGKSKLIKMIKAQIYLLVPFIVFASIVYIVKPIILSITTSDIDSIMSTIQKMGYTIVIVYYTFLNTKVIAKLQGISIKKAILNNIILVAIALIVTMDAFKFIGDTITIEKANKQYEFYEEKMKLNIE